MSTKKLFIIIIISSFLMLYYSFYAHLQAVTGLIHVEALREIIPCDSSNVVEDLTYQLKSIKGANRAIALNIKMIGFFLLLNIVLSIAGIFKAKAPNPRH